MKKPSVIFGAILGVALALPLRAQTVTTVVNNGPSAELYDMVFLGDGYTAAQQALFNQDVLDVISYFRTNPATFPYNSYFHCYNVHTVFRASAESGADQPPLNIFRNTVYDASYWIGGTERCLYIQNTAQAAADAALAPDSDGRVIVLVNDSKYGGCAGTYSVSYNGSSMEDVQAHEWGHSFGGLADEYEYGASGTYSGPEFGEPNVTNSSSGNKWAPWLGFAGPHGTTGAWVGGRYYAAGVWRPEPDCEMRSLFRNFCTVCRQAFIVAFNRECDMISQESPAGASSAPRHSQKTFSFTNRLATRPHTIEWRVDAGAWVAGTTSFIWNIGAASIGTHSVQVRVMDTSPQVRQDPAGHLVHVHTWSVNVTGSASKLDAGIAEVLPAAAAGIEQNSSTAYPFNTSGGMRVMYAYGGSMLGHRHPVHIAGIAFRPEGGTATFGPATYDLRVDVSTGSNPATALVAGFDGNHGADRATVFDGALSVGTHTLGTSPSSFVIVVPFAEPFAWNPGSGPLVIDLRHRGIVTGNGVATDGLAAVPGDYGRIAHLSDPNAATATFNGGSTQAFALTAELLLDCFSTPSTLAFTEGNSGSPFPWGASNLRAQYAYEGATFDFTGRHRITRLAWRSDNGNAFNGVSYDLRITLSTGANGLTAAMSPSFANNAGPDATVVYDGVLAQPAFPVSTAPGRYSFQVELQRPFEYDPSAGALLVDLQVRSASGSPGTAFDGTSGSGVGVAQCVALGWNAATGGAPQDFGLVLALSAVPSPVLPQASDHVDGALATGYPFGVHGQMRAQHGYSGSQLGVTDPVEITHLSWRPDAAATSFGPVSYQARIDLSTGTLPLVANFASNHGADLVTVFNGEFSVPYYAGKASGAEDFAIQVALDRPFRWDPTRGALIVDIRKATTVAGTAGGNLDFAAGSPSDLGRAVHTTDPDATTADFGPHGNSLVIRLGGEGRNATVKPYGNGCLGAAGVPVNSSIGLPWLGNQDFAHALFRARPTANAILLFGLAPANTPLTVLGAPSCSLLHDAVLGSLGTTTDATGRASVPAAVPNTPALAGATIRSQWLVVDAAGAGSPIPIAMSAGAALTLR
ncbi:MAG: hypothetical protein IT457_14080 [Planctomycetes bacterium]|nr:hypothetical protein [Planctomycetota bacterium]